MTRFLTLLLFCLATGSFLVSPATATSIDLARGDKFRQLDEILPTPGPTRNASGAPGAHYWQQKVDYQIEVAIDDKTQALTGAETITYTNNSPDTLRYLWVQLDQNRHRTDSVSSLTQATREMNKASYGKLRFELEKDFGGGHQILSVTTSAGAPLAHTVVDTMMRIDLPQALQPGQRTTFSIAWTFKIPDATVSRSRSGYEFFEKDENYIYVMAQWFPRLAAYSDVKGWHTKQFLGLGEFTLEFGDYQVAITVPDDHIVSATGELQNVDDVLTATMRDRMAQAQDAEAPVFIVTPDEAKNAESKDDEDSKKTATKTWRFAAENVRDFAFASSRKFIWDAQGHEQSDGSRVLAMSFYPNEGVPLWDKYSTAAIIHTLNVYSRYTFLYPYPIAQSVNGPVGGMEYPMVSFNGPRPDEDKETGEKAYSSLSKYSLISVIIHEIGHNYFPMVVNSDERNWTWMDEGLNTFLQFLAEEEWEEEYPSRRGEPRSIVDYMKGARQVPIMTQSDSVLDLGNNAYGKPATALNILRETILGRELFDFAFREYAIRWKFKRPMPADFFRSMEDASGVDLDWFWRGWFYTTDHVDISIDGVTRYSVDTKNPDIERPLKRDKKKGEPLSLTKQRNKDIERLVDRKPDLLDFYNENDRYTVTKKDQKKYTGLVEGLEDWEKEILEKEENFYVLDFSNKGGLVMPIILAITYEDGSEEEIRLPAEIWRLSSSTTRKLLVSDKFISSVVVDPHWETADTDIENNNFPRRVVPSRIEVFKMDYKTMARNLMKDVLDGEKEEAEEKEKAQKEEKEKAEEDGMTQEAPDNTAPEDNAADSETPDSDQNTDL